MANRVEKAKNTLKEMMMLFMFVGMLCLYVTIALVPIGIACIVGEFCGAWAGGISVVVAVLVDMFAILYIGQD